jgi:hypothetical protein
VLNLAATCAVSFKGGLQWGMRIESSPLKGGDPLSRSVKLLPWGF